MDIPGGDHLFLAAMAVLFGWLTAHYGRRLAGVARGLRADGRAAGVCVRVETEAFNRSDTERYVFAFRTPDGREIEFEDLATRAIRVGTEVTVVYDPAAPERTATVAGQGSWSPVTQSVLLVTGCGLAALGFTAIFLFTMI